MNAVRKSALRQTKGSLAQPLVRAVIAAGGRDVDCGAAIQAAHIVVRVCVIDAGGHAVVGNKGA
jgi:hypothetical protein